MILQLVEADRPRSLTSKLSEYLARPPKPILRFHGAFRQELGEGCRHIKFAVRNGLPLPLFYGIHGRVKYDSATDYIEKRDHIGPFSTDDWRLTIDTEGPAQVEIRVGLVPFEIQTDITEIAVGHEHRV